jgi:CRP/FNR family transcriptional regulator, cyclic AMP receptor protein
MNTSSMANLLSEQRFFAGIPDRFVATIGELASERRADIDELLWRQGQRADRFYLVKTGRIAIEQYAPGRDPIVVDQASEGDVVGWSWLVAPYRWTFDARAVEPSSLIDIDAAALRDRFGVDPILGYEVMQRFFPVMGRRLSSALERLVECITEQS